nr:ATP synthase F0 subunit 8 [Pyrocoelia sp.]
MPQMGPLNWLMLMIYFSTMMILYNTFIYSMLYYSSKTMNIKKMFKTNWKW